MSEEEFAFEDDVGNQVTDDINDILLGDDGERQEEIPTGIVGPGGQQRYMRVTIKDARAAGLMTSYSMMEQEDPERAMRMLWKKCLVKPEGLHEEDKFKRLPSTFRESLTIRILRLNGFDSFFERLGLMSERPEVLRALNASSLSSQKSTASPQQESVKSSVKQTSSPPTI